MGVKAPPVQSPWPPSNVYVTVLCRRDTPSQVYVPVAAGSAAVIPLAKAFAASAKNEVASNGTARKKSPAATQEWRGPDPNAAKVLLCELGAAPQVLQRLGGADIPGTGEEVLPHLPAGLDAPSARKVVEALVERPDHAFDAQSIDPGHGVHVRLLPEALRGGDERAAYRRPRRGTSSRQSPR